MSADSKRQHITEEEQPETEASSSLTTLSPSPMSSSITPPNTKNTVAEKIKQKGFISAYLTEHKALMAKRDIKLNAPGFIRPVDILNELTQKPCPIPDATPQMLKELGTLEAELLDFEFSDNNFDEKVAKEKYQRALRVAPEEVVAQRLTDLRWLKGRYPHKPAEPLEFKTLFKWQQPFSPHDIINFIESKEHGSAGVKLSDEAKQGVYALEALSCRWAMRYSPDMATHSNYYTKMKAAALAAQDAEILDSRVLEALNEDELSGIFAWKCFWLPIKREEHFYRVTNYPLSSFEVYKQSINWAPWQEATLGHQLEQFKETIHRLAKRYLDECKKNLPTSLSTPQDYDKWHKGAYKDLSIVEELTSKSEHFHPSFKARAHELDAHITWLKSLEVSGDARNKLLMSAKENLIAAKKHAPDSKATPNLPCVYHLQALNAWEMLNKVDEEEKPQHLQTILLNLSTLRRLAGHLNMLDPALFELFETHKKDEKQSAPKNNSSRVLEARVLHAELNQGTLDPLEHIRKERALESLLREIDDSGFKPDDYLFIGELLANEQNIDAYVKGAQYLRLAEKNSSTKALAQEKLEQLHQKRKESKKVFYIKLNELNTEEAVNKKLDELEKILQDEKQSEHYLKNPMSFSPQGVIAFAENEMNLRLSPATKRRVIISIEFIEKRLNDLEKELLEAKSSPSLSSKARDERTRNQGPITLWEIIQRIKNKSSPLYKALTKRACTLEALRCWIQYTYSTDNMRYFHRHNMAEAAWGAQENNLDPDILCALLNYESDKVLANKYYKATQLNLRRFYEGMNIIDTIEIEIPGLFNKPVGIQSIDIALKYEFRMWKYFCLAAEKKPEFLASAVQKKSVTVCRKYPYVRVSSSIFGTNTGVETQRDVYRHSIAQIEVHIRALQESLNSTYCWKADYREVFDGPARPIALLRKLMTMKNVDPKVLTDLSDLELRILRLEVEHYRSQNPQILAEKESAIKCLEQEGLLISLDPANKSRDDGGVPANKSRDDGGVPANESRDDGVEAKSTTTSNKSVDNESPTNVRKLAKQATPVSSADWEKNLFAIEEDIPEDDPAAVAAAAKAILEAKQMNAQVKLQNATLMAEEAPRQNTSWFGSPMSHFSKQPKPEPTKPAIPAGGLSVNQTGADRAVELPRSYSVMGQDPNPNG